MSHPRPKISQDETYVFNLSPKILDSLQLMYFDSSTVEEVLPQAPLITNKQEKVPEVATKEAKSVDYYKSDLHRFNLKREIRGLPKLSEEEFEKLTDELNESISGSEESETDSDEDDNLQSKNLYSRERDTLDTIFEKSIQKLQRLAVNDKEESVITHLATRSPFILFKSDLLDEDKCFGVYKSLFSIEELETPIEALKSWNSSKENLGKKSALFMIGGGHFAGAIINHKPRSTKGNTVKAGDSLMEQSVDVIAHKSFHRYTTRRKQGGSQSASDNARGKANSAGSSLRRHNEAALQQEVRELLQSWKTHLDECDSIFIRANGASNKGIIVGYEGAVLKNDDGRIKSFPFTTKRATTSELKRAWIQLTYLSLTTKPKIDDKKIQQKQLQDQLKQSTIKKVEKVKEVSQDEKHSSELIGYLKKSRGPVLISYLKKYKLSPDFELQPEIEYYNTPTLLHYAAAHGIKNLIGPLIKTAKASISVLNKNGKTPYEISSSKQVRQSFQILRFELGEDFTDWEKGHVGKPISREEVEHEENEAKNRLEEEKKELINQELAKKVEDLSGTSKTVKLPGISNITANLSSLSEEQRRRLMREQRARAAEARFKAMQQQK